MAAFVKSVERIQTTFPNSNALQTNTVNLGKGQDETQCVPFYTMRFTASYTDQAANRAISIEMIDNAGTAAARIRRQGSGANPQTVTVEITVIEFGSNVTVQQNTGAPITITGTSLTENITTVGALDRCFVVFNQHAVDTSTGDDFNDQMIQASFNSTSQIAFERRAGGNPDWVMYYYVVESNGTDFLTEYAEVTWTGSDNGPTDHTLSNDVGDLAHAFIICTYETAENSDDMLDAIVNFALTDTNTLTWYRNHGETVSFDGTYGVWVVRASATELDVQHFATDVNGQLTSSQAITSFDSTRSAVIPGHHVGSGAAWCINSSTSGGVIDNFMHTILMTSGTNVDVQRFADTTPDGINNIVRYDVVEFERESTGDSFTTNIADTVGVTDTIAVALDIVLLEAEAVGVTDDLSLVGQFFRTEADSVIVTDTVIPSISFIRNFADSVGVTDIIIAAVGKIAALADTIGVTDAITTLVGNVRLLEDTIGVTDTLTKIGTFIKAITDSVGVADTLATSVGVIITFADSVTVADTIITTGVFFRNLAESVGITDAISTLVILTRSLADSIDVTDTVTIAISYVKLLSETIDITDTVSSVLTYIKTLADPVGVTDTLALVGTYIKTFVDTIDITDSINTAVSISISLADTTNITDAISSLIILTRSIADTVGITDIISTAVGRVAVLTDTVNITDTVSIIGNYIREIVNPVNITDIFSTVGIFSRTIAESVIITDIRTHVGIFVISLQNTVTITDIIASLKLVIVSLSNTVGITDTISTTVSLAIFIVGVIELQVRHSRNLQRMIKRGKKIIRELRS